MGMIAINDGQRLLIELDCSLSHVAKVVGKSSPTVHGWKHGERLPPQQARAAMEEAFQIPVTAWDVALPPNHVVKVPERRKGGRPTKKQAAANARIKTLASDDPDIATKRKVFTQNEEGKAVPIPPYPERPTEDSSSVAQVQYQLDCIRHDLEYESLSVAGKSKLRADETRAMAQLEKFKKEAEMAEDRYVREHPAWRRFTTRLLEALEPHPGASRDVLDALQAIEA